MSRQKLITKALRSATPVQLIRVRDMLGSRLNKFGCDCIQGDIQQARRDFDAEHYDSPAIAKNLSDEELVIALGQEEYRITSLGEVKRTSEPRQKYWCVSRGGWYDE